MDYFEIVAYLKTALSTKSANTFFINGAPGSGKSYLHRRLTDILPEEIPHVKILGPYLVQSGEELGKLILEDLHGMMYLPEIPDRGVIDGLASALYWLNDNLSSDFRLTFVVLIDLKTSWSDYDAYRVIFSSFRNLEGNWTHMNVRLAAVMTGFWDHPGLQDLYREYVLSFPYTPSKNYVVWEEIPLSETEILLGDMEIEEAIRPVFVKQFHQVSGGNPAIMQDILDNIAPGSPSIEELLNVARTTASDSPVSRHLVEILKKFPTETLSAVENLLYYRIIPIRSLSDSLDRLRSAGVVREVVSLGQRYVTLRSWYIELLLRLNATELGIQSSLENLETLMPTISIVNREAYLLLQEIETLLRNHLVNLLSKERGGSATLLADIGHKNVRYFQEGQIFFRQEDAHERAADWMERSRDRGLPVHLNPNIAYLSLTDLSNIITEIGQTTDTTDWQHVQDAVQGIVSIRDAVMHNQIIEFSDLKKILDLKNDLLSALNSLG